MNVFLLIVMLLTVVVLSIKIGIDMAEKEFPSLTELFVLAVEFCLILYWYA